MMHLEAFDLLAHAEVIEQRLVATIAVVATKEGLVEERAWLEGVHRNLARARGSIGDLLVRALRLPELEPLRGERARSLQTAVVEAVERLQIAITTAVERSPLVEIIYRNLKPPGMVRANRETFEQFCEELEKRLASSYVTRMLADESYLSVAPALETFRSAVKAWRDLFAGAAMPEDDARALRNELEATASKLELPLRQVRLVAEAALIPVDTVLATSGLLDKPKRRAARVVVAEDVQPTS
jgi:hypothetical protein